MRQGLVAPLLLVVLFGASLGRAQQDEAPPSEPSEPPEPSEPSEPSEPVTPAAPEQGPESEPPPEATAPAAPAESPEASETASDEPAEVVIRGTPVTQSPGSAYVINNKKLERTELDAVAEP